jgi:hypothetical protein
MFFVNRQAYTFHGMWGPLTGNCFSLPAPLFRYSTYFLLMTYLWEGWDRRRLTVSARQYRHYTSACSIGPSAGLDAMKKRKISGLCLETNLGSRARSLVAIKRLIYPGSTYYIHDNIKYCFLVGMDLDCRAQWPCGLRLEPSLLGSWVPTPLEAWMSVLKINELKKRLRPNKGLQSQRQISDNTSDNMETRRNSCSKFQLRATFTFFLLVLSR